MNRDDFETLMREELKILPDQAPLEHFVHHNNLHFFENEPFEQAVENTFLGYGKSPYMSLSYYRRQASKGEIGRSFFDRRLLENGFRDLAANLKDFIYEALHSFQDPEEIRFFRDEGLMYSKDGKSVLRQRGEDFSIWSRVERLRGGASASYPDFHVNRSLGEVNKLLTPVLAVLLDQGQAQEQLPERERRRPWAVLDRYLSKAVSKESYKRFQTLSDDKIDSKERLYEKFIKERSAEEARKFIRFHLQGLPGWAGMIHKVSQNKEVIPRKDVYLNIYDYLLMRAFLFEVLGKRPKTELVPLNSDALLRQNVFHYLRHYQGKESEQDLFQLFSELSPLVLRRIFQQSMEDTYRNTVLEGLRSASPAAKRNPKFQMFFCIDDREESFRRYLEESSSEVETFGVAGFFGLDMVFQKVGEPRARRFCPPAASPKFWIKEEGKSFKFSGAPFLHHTPSSFFRATAASFLFSPLKSLELKWHLFAPRSKKMFFSKFSLAKPKGVDYEAQGLANGYKLGFNKKELAQRVAGILKGAGLVKSFAPYILMIGHGHDSFNNPHVAAYRCGACSGANAWPNAKIFASAANDPEVRKLLSSDHGIDIPGKSYFVGGYHDTCNDKVELYDIDPTRMSETDRLEIEKILLCARELNALERTRKFYQASASSPREALKAVEARAWHVAEPRPELNHATNALAIVGRRSLTEGAFLDRKAFLVSYDPELDDEEASLLAGLLGAVVPVCAGINLEYYFSKVDTENYGSGSKTSHNVSGLLGVMNGVRGDLRTGLVWQMVEYHDPLRITFVIEATEKSVLKVMETNPQVANMIKNLWVYTVVVNPQKRSEMKIFRNGGFEPLESRSVDIPAYESSQQVPTGLEKGVHFANIKGVYNG